MLDESGAPRAGSLQVAARRNHQAHAAEARCAHDQISCTTNIASARAGDAGCMVWAPTRVVALRENPKNVDFVTGFGAHAHGLAYHSANNDEFVCTILTWHTERRCSSNGTLAKRA